MFDALQKRLANWIQELRLNGHTVVCTDIWIRPLNLVKMPEFAVKKPANFVASVGWCNHFMIQHNLCVRARTKLAQKLPKVLECKIKSFQRHLINLRKKCKFELSQIGNMDKTSVIIPSKTEEQKQCSSKLPDMRSDGLHGRWNPFALHYNF